jgi:hypothetical protein
MEFLTWFFLESVVALAGTLTVILFILLVYWRNTLRARPLLIGCVAAAALLIVQALVVTKREHADRTMKRIEAAVLESQPQGVGAELSARFFAEPPKMDQTRFVELVRTYMQTVDVRTLYRSDLELSNIQSGAFDAEVSYIADISARDFSGTVVSRWRLRFEREADGWRIVNIIPIMLNKQPVNGWRDLH